MLVPESSLDWTQPIPNTEVDVDELEHDGYGFVYNEEPFTGIAVSHYPDGQRESYRPCLNGFPHGFCRWWHANGRPSAEWTSYRGMDGRPNITKAVVSERGIMLNLVNHLIGGSLMKWGEKLIVVRI